MIKSSLNDLIGELPTSSNSYNWIDYKYYIEGSNSTAFMWYQDINLNSELYRAVYFTSYRPSNNNKSSSLENSFQDENGYYVSTVYYFKYEPITWKVLKLDTENNKAFLFANIALDSQDFNHIDTSNTINGETIYANNYEYSTIRKWLNDNFFNTAFNANEKSIILDIDVDNSASSTGYKTNKYECNNTLDKLFLLSYQDAINPEYSFDSVYSEKDENRQLKATDYASIQGRDQSSHSSNLENCEWWLRSPFPLLPNVSNMVSGVTDSGNIGLASNVSNTVNGIVPALWISIGEIKEHSHTSSDWIQVSNLTCEDDGYRYKECITCHKIIDEEIVKATGHNYNDKNICGTCGDGCEHVKEIKYLITPTCVEEGYWELVCSLCGYSENEILEKTPHEYINGICNICNTKEFSSGLVY